MKKILSLLLAFTCLKSFPQAPPPEMNYQTVIRNNEGVPMTNTSASFTFIIHDVTPTGTPVFTETQNTTSNSVGIVALQIGAVNNLSIVNWGSGPKYLEVDANINGQTEADTTELISVPYALYTAQSGDGWYWGGYAVFDEVEQFGDSSLSKLTSNSWSPRYFNHTEAQSSNQRIAMATDTSISLPAGSYHIFASAPFNSTNNGAFSALRIRTFPADTTVLVSQVTQPFNGIGLATIDGVFTVPASCTISLQHYISTASPSQSGGTIYDVVNFAENSVYARLLIRKIR